MKIAKTGIIKKQNASRNISRITKKYRLFNLYSKLFYIQPQDLQNLYQNLLVIQYLDLVNNMNYLNSIINFIRNFLN